MKPVTEKQKQWLWFIGLWFTGLGTTALLAYAVRWVMKM
jgi:hypothetical protein